MLGRSVLKGMKDDLINGILCGVGHNLLKIMASARFGLYGSAATWYQGARVGPPPAISVVLALPRITVVPGFGAVGHIRNPIPLDCLQVRIPPICWWSRRDSNARPSA